MAPPRVAIIADDLTGALDVCAPFARRGLRCRIAVVPEGLAEALSGEPDIVCVNTASRELEAPLARARLEQVASQLAQARPDIAFNKIDSRLKGHVRLSLEIGMTAFGRPTALIAPAVPAQNRVVENGRIVGAGVSSPITIADIVGTDAAFTIADGRSEDDMQSLAQRHHATSLLCGASGLGAGLARLLAGPEARPLLAASGPLLFAIGSHDPTTEAQVLQLRAIADLALYETRDGQIAAALPAAGTTLCRATSDPDAPGHGAALALFGRSIAEQIRRGAFASVLLCGGETAQTVLDALGVKTLELLGEALPGIPVSQALIAGRTVTILTKSGGFGKPDDLYRIAEAARPGNPKVSSTSAGIPA